MTQFEFDLADRIQKIKSVGEKFMMNTEKEIIA
jgi:hypothetical protein